MAKNTNRLLTKEIIYQVYHRNYSNEGTFKKITEDFIVKFNIISKYNEYLLEPLDHLMNCEYNVYALQVSIYAYMFELLTGKSCQSLRIFYLRDSTGKYWQEYNVPYMKLEVERLLNHYITYKV